MGEHTLTIKAADADTWAVRLPACYCHHCGAAAYLVISKAIDIDEQGCWRVPAARWERVSCTLAAFRVRVEQVS